MKFQLCNSNAAQRGSASLVLINLAVLLLIVVLGTGYYFFQMRPAMAVAEFEKGREMEKKGHLTSAELAYREAIRLDPSNAHYHTSLDALVRGEGNLKADVASVGKPGPRTASAGLFPEPVSSTPSLSGTAPLDNTTPPPLTEPRIARKNVELVIAAPEGAEYEIVARNTPLYVPGETLVPWAIVADLIQRELPIGEYELVVRMPGAEPAEERFTVKEEGGVLQTVKFRFGLLRIDSVPSDAEVFDALSEDPIGKTPFAMLVKPGDVAFTLRAEGYKDSSLEGNVSTRGVLHFNHQLAAVSPPPAAPPAKPAVEKEPAPTAVAAVKPAPAKPEPKKPEPKKPEPKAPEPVVVAAAILEQPVFGKPFVSAAGLEYIFGEKSVRGDPFWITASTPLEGWEKGAAQDYCSALTAKEAEAGRVPRGYAYFPSIAGDGRIALCRNYYDDEKPTLASVQPRRELAADSETPEVTPLGGAAEVSQELPTRKAVVVADEAGAGMSRESFINSERMWMEYRQQDVYGNPFWRSAEPVVGGMSLARANQLCAQLTERERAAGRVPDGYTYAVAGEGDGRVVLWRNVLPGRVTSSAR